MTPAKDPLEARVMLEQYDRGTVSLAKRIAFGRSAYKAVPEESRIAAAAVLESIPRLGFRFLGQHTTVGLVPFFRPRRERYVDREGIVVLNARRGMAHGPFEASQSKYILSTYFEDGSCVITWSRPDAPVPSTERDLERGGTGSLEFDYKSHLEAVRARNARPVVVRDLETSLALDNYYDQRLRPSSAVFFLVMRVMLVAVIVRFVMLFFHHRR